MSYIRNLLVPLIKSFLYYYFFILTLDSTVEILFLKNISVHVFIHLCEYAVIQINAISLYKHAYIQKKKKTKLMFSGK